MIFFLNGGQRPPGDNKVLRSRHYHRVGDVSGLLLTGLSDPSHFVPLLSSQLLHVGGF